MKIKDEQGVIYDYYDDYCAVIGIEENASTDIIIPSRIDGHRVCDIFDDSFKDDEKLRSVKISEGIKYIAPYAFFGCTSLTSVIIPRGIENIGGGAFELCNSLTDVLYTGDKKSWDRIIIWNPNSILREKVRFQSDTPQSEKKALATRTSGGTAANSEREPGPVMMKQFNGYVVVAPGDCAEENVIIPSIYNGMNVVEIANEAFKNCRSLKSVIIPPSITRVGFDAFAGCTALESVTIPKSVSKLDSRAFRKCDALREINYQGSKFDWDKLEMDVSFAKFMSKVKFLGGAQISMTESVNTNPDITQSQTGDMRTVAKSAGLAYKKRGDGLVVTGIGSCEDSDLVIPETHDGLPVVGVAAKAFYVLMNGFPQMKSVRFPGTLTSIGVGAFWGCTSLTEVTVPSGVRVIEQSAFRGCSSLVKIKIPESVKIIGPYAFSECETLEQILIPDSVTEIGDYAFSRCKSLKNISVPNNVERIGNYVFSECDALTFVRIPHWVTSIGAGAFYGCASITTVMLPRALVKLSGNAFDQCGALKYICAADSEYEWENVEIDDPDGCFNDSLLYFEGDVSYPNGKHWTEDTYVGLLFSFDSY